MRKLFTGRFGRIPAALLATVLISVLVAGGVVAATSSYTLWEGEAEVTVTEPVHIYWGTAEGDYPYELLLGGGDPLGASIGLVPGACVHTYFNITSNSPDDLLIKAIAESTDDTVVTITFNVTELTTTGLLVNSSTDILVTRTACASGAASGGPYTVYTGFTRESAP